MLGGKTKVYWAGSVALLAIAACGSGRASVTPSLTHERRVVASAPANAPAAAIAPAPTDTVVAGTRICTRYLGSTASFIGAATAGAVARIATQAGRDPRPWSSVPAGELVAQCEYARSGTVFSAVSTFVDAAGHRTQTPTMRPLP